MKKLTSCAAAALLRTNALARMGLCLLLLTVGMCLAFNSQPAHASDSYWYIEVIDGAVAHPSIVLDVNGNPHVCYYDSGDHDLKYAYHDGVSWNVETVDAGVGMDDWVETCIALDSNGNPHISYYDFSNNTNHDLKYAYYDGSWHKITIDTGWPNGYCGSRNSIVVDGSDTPHISYSEDYSDQVKYAYYDGTSHPTVVDAVGSDNPPNSIALDSNDSLYISYTRGVSPALGYAYRDGSWNTTGVASGGGEPSIALDSADYAHIAHRSGYDLMYTYFDGAIWNTETVDGDTGPSVGKWPSLAFGCDDHRHISYYDATARALKYAYHDGGIWRTETVDSIDMVGLYSSLALECGDIPHIVYYDATNDYLKYAYLIPWGPVLSTSPARNELNVPCDTVISVTFVTDMNAATINQFTFVVNARSTGPHQGVITYDDSTRTATFDPDSSFCVGEVVTVVLTAEIQSSEGQFLNSSYVWSFTTEVGGGPGAFAVHADYPAGDGPSGVFAADLDGDDYLDLAVTNYNDSTVSVLINNGDGSFAPPVDYPANEGPNSVFAADFTGDGLIDLAIPNYDSNYVTVLQNDGGGVFSLRSTPMAGSSPASVYGADLDGDGYPDLAVANSASGNVSVLINQADGTFALLDNYPVQGDPWSISATDLDSDGDLDLATTNQDSNSVSVLLNNGDGSFAWHADLAVGDFPTSVFAADLDGEGHNDLTTADQISNNISFLLNAGCGCFAPTFAGTTYNVGAAPQSVFAADLNGDGYLDLATAEYTSSSVTVLYNNGDSTFTCDSSCVVNAGPVSVFSADLDGDGDLDLATANYDSNNVSILLNRDISGVDEQPVAGLPTAIVLSQNYPNPFGPITEVKYGLPKACHVTLEIYNILGQRVVTLVDEHQQAGYKTIRWDARGLRGAEAASGVYFCRLKAGNQKAIRKMILLK